MIDDAGDRTHLGRPGIGSNAVTSGVTPRNIDVWQGKVTEGITERAA